MTKGEKRDVIISLYNTFVLYMMVLDGDRATKIMFLRTRINNFKEDHLELLDRFLRYKNERHPYDTKDYAQSLLDKEASENTNKKTQHTKVQISCIFNFLATDSFLEVLIEKEKKPENKKKVYNEFFLDPLNDFLETDK